MSRESTPVLANGVHPVGEWHLSCNTCQAVFNWTITQSSCPECRAVGRIGLLECHFSPERKPSKDLIRQPSVIESYHSLLPPTKNSRTAWDLTGNTPLKRSKHIASNHGLENLFFKIEAANPTGSFKDRYAAVTVSLAKGAGYRCVAVSSTGNLGISVAYYASLSKMPCVVIVPSGTPTPFIDQLEHYGAYVAETTPEGRHLFLEYLGSLPFWFAAGLFLKRKVQNPYGIEGYKTFAYEVLSQLNTSPDFMMFPCARGNNLYGSWKGFQEAHAWGWSDSLPKMIACQPDGADSLRVSLHRGTSQAIELPAVSSVAFSTSETVAGDESLSAIRDSKGSAYGASDTRILEAVNELKAEGINVEPSSALPIACLPTFLEECHPSPAAIIVCVLTAGERNPTAHKHNHLPNRHEKLSPSIQSLKDYLVRQCLDIESDLSNPSD